MLYASETIHIRRTAQLGSNKDVRHQMSSSVGYGSLPSSYPSTERVLSQIQQFSHQSTDFCNWFYWFPASLFSLFTLARYERKFIWQLPAFTERLVQLLALPVSLSVSLSLTIALFKPRGPHKPLFYEKGSAKYDAGNRLVNEYREHAGDYDLRARRYCTAWLIACSEAT